MRLLIPTLCLLVMLQACSFSGSPPPEEHFYRLPDLLANKSQQGFDTVYLRSVMAEGIYNERAILYVKDDAPLEVRRYHYHHWLNAPGKLIHEQFKNYLTGTGLARQIVDRRLAAQDLDISVQLRNFERLTGASSRVLVELDMAVYGAESVRPVLSKNYRLELPAGSSMHDTAAAFGRVLSRLFAQMSEDLISLKKD